MKRSSPLTDQFKKNTRKNDDITDRPKKKKKSKIIAIIVKFSLPN